MIQSPLLQSAQPGPKPLGWIPRQTMSCERPVFICTTRDRRKPCLHLQVHLPRCKDLFLLLQVNKLRPCEAPPYPHRGVDGRGSSPSHRRGLVGGHCRAGWMPFVTRGTFSISNHANICPLSWRQREQAKRLWCLSSREKVSSPARSSPAGISCLFLRGLCWITTEQKNLRQCWQAPAQCVVWVFL